MPGCAPSASNCCSAGNRCDSSIATTVLRDGGCDAVAVCMGAAVIDPPPGVFGIVVADWADGLSASVRAALDEASLVGAAQVILHLIDLPDVTAPVISRVLAAADATAPLSPRLGRARPLAERSIGHPDAGAVSLALLSAKIADVL